MTQPIDPKWGWTPQMQRELDAIHSVEGQQEFMDEWHEGQQKPVPDFKALVKREPDAWVRVDPVPVWQLWHYPCRYAVRFKCCEQHGVRTYGRFTDFEQAKVIAGMIAESILRKAGKGSALVGLNADGDIEETKLND